MNYSIKQRLVKSIALFVAGILISVLLLTDISVDTWIADEFDSALENKANTLISLIRYRGEDIEFDFSDELMPEFSNPEQPEYFQLWLEGKVLSRSLSLTVASVDLPLQMLPLNNTLLTDFHLPDGRDGRLLIKHFTPQIDTQEGKIARGGNMYLALAKSTQTHDRITLLIDLMFIIASLLSALLARYVVKRIVVKGLRPLDMLNAQLKQVNISSDAKKIELNGSIVELTPIVDSINQFIEVNSQLYRREKQLTSDIAHELKTPISELLNLVEVHQKFPNDKQLSESFDQELLIIAQRMKGLVDNMLLFQRSQLFGRVVEQKALDLVQLIQTVVYRKLKVYDSVDRLCCQFHQPCLPVLVPPFALETIVRNLLVNALCHGDPSSPVVLRTMAVDGGIELQIENKFSGALSKDEMAQMFDPLWRKDKSRSSSENHGLGLSIVKSFCDQCDYVLTVEKPEADLLRFSLVIPTT